MSILRQYNTLVWGGGDCEVNLGGAIGVIESGTQLFLRETVTDGGV